MKAIRKSLPLTHIARSSLIIAFFFGVDKVLGFIRQVLVARQFALTYEIDAFNVANNIPDLLSALISGGALGVALIPVLAEYLQTRDRPASWDLFARILNLAFLVTAALAIVTAILARPLVTEIIAPGFPSSQQDLAIRLMRMDLIAIVIFSLSGLIMAGLQANQHFILPAMAPALYNIGQIFGLVILSPEMGYTLGPLRLPGLGLGVYGLVYGVILGALLHLAIQIPGLLRYQFHWKAGIDLRHPGVKKVLALLGPRVLTMFFLQLFFITRDNLASHLGEGAVTALNYGWFIMQVPETLVGTAIGIAILPTLAEQFARGEEAQFSQTFSRAIRSLIAITLPIAALLGMALPPIVTLIFGFSPEGVERVVWATRGYLLGLAGHSLLEIAARAFYARQDARTPLFAAALNAGAYFIFAVTLARWLGEAGIAAANALAFTSEAILLLWLLQRRLPGILRLGSTLPRALAISILGGLIVYFTLRLSLPPLPLIFGALALGGIFSVPFVWADIRLLFNL